MLADVEPVTDADGVRRLLVVHDRALDDDGAPVAAPNGMLSVVAEADVADRDARRTARAAWVRVTMTPSTFTSSRCGTTVRQASR
ncbi:hypothetical protein, partial [Micrococcus sp. F3Y]|uniref:hypothetical protein n=1 Tax=Micrococcus sp. F3Y TaxID=3402627 RepID=UPI003AF4CCCE